MVTIFSPSSDMEYWQNVILKQAGLGLLGLLMNTGDIKKRAEQICCWMQSKQRRLDRGRGTGGGEERCKSAAASLPHHVLLHTAVS